MDAVPRIGVKVCTDGPMSALETSMDWCSKERFLARIVRAETKTYGSAIGTNFPDIDFEEIMDDETRNAVKLLI